MNGRNRADAVVMGTGSRLVDYLSIREVRQSFYEACGDDAAIYEPVFEPIRSVLERGELIHKTITDPVLRKALVATDRRVFDVRGAQLARSLSTVRRATSCRSFSCLLSG